MSETLSVPPPLLPILHRWGTLSECLLLIIFSAGRSDLRLLSGDAFSVYPKNLS